MSLRIVTKSNDPKLQKLREDLDRKYARYLHGIVDEIFDAATEKKDWSWPQLAKAAGISYSTILKLGNRITRYPRHMTVWKMAKAVGLPYELQAPPQQVTLKRRAG